MQHQTASEIDAAVMRMAHEKWQKVAMIIVRTQKEHVGWTWDEVHARIVALVAEGKLEGVGDLSRPRWSEVRFSDNSLKS